jgi:hypothetical protein
VSLRWKDVTAITKEKTALVIPNAILVCTEGEKLFFTSFGARDKTYLMLFRVWQNALLDQVGALGLSSLVTKKDKVFPICTMKAYRGSGGVAPLYPPPPVPIE